VANKPPIPAEWDQPFPRITVDESAEGAFDQVMHIAVSAADGWYLRGITEGRLNDMSHSEIAQGQVREALLHLLELGLIDIDEERLNGLHMYPGWRNQ
jgi:hypothetical protein